MDFKTAIETCLKQKYKDFTGRASRSEYWYFVLGYVILSVILSVVGAILPAMLATLINLAVGLAILLPNIAVGIRRLHDTNRSGWFLLLGLVPLVNFVLIYFLAQKGTEGENTYGPAVV